MLRIEILFDKNAKQKPSQAVLNALEKEIDKKLADTHENYCLRIAYGSSQSMGISGTANKDEKEAITQLLENIWLDDSWMPEEENI